MLACLKLATMPRTRCVSLTEKFATEQNCPGKEEGRTDNVELPVLEEFISEELNRTAEVPCLATTTSAAWNF